MNHKDVENDRLQFTSHYIGRMTNNKCVTMLVCWKQQRRLINLKSDDDLNTIKKSIIDIYNLQQINHFDEYQIQYYDEIYQEFIDLYSETIQRFQQVVQKLLLSDGSTKNENNWHLRIIPKAIEIIRMFNNIKNHFHFH